MKSQPSPTPRRSSRLAALELAAALLLALIPRPAAALPPPPSLIGGATVEVAPECCSTGAPARLMLKLEIYFVPAPALRSVRVGEQGVAIELLLPDRYQTTQGNLYEAWVPVEVPPPAEDASLPVAIGLLESPDDPEADPLPLTTPARLNFRIAAVQLLQTIPARPTPADPILLVLDRLPPGPTTWIAGEGGQIRLAGGGPFPWPAATPGSPLRLGPLPAGRYRVAIGEGPGIEFDLEVFAPPTPPAEQAILAGGFEVTATWKTAAGEIGPARLVQPPSQDSALFYFFSPENWELMVKVLDGCAINGHYWVFGAASTDAGYHLEVRRPETGEIFEVDNPVGRTAPAITEIEAFPCGSGLLAGFGG